MDNLVFAGSLTSGDGPVRGFILERRLLRLYEIAFASEQG